jgi:DNA-binding transcriptional regulator YhcF (GntR family)
MIKIDTQSCEPLVDQVCNVLKHAIANDFLQPGQELPSARQLAGDLNIHWNTVSRAYRQLAAEGLLFVAHGRKTCVVDRNPGQRPPSKSEIDEVTSLINRGLTQAKLYGIEKHAIATVFNDALLQWKN